MNFWKILLATILGITLSMVVLFLLLLGFISSAVSNASEKKATSVQNNTVLLVKLDRVIAERSEDDPLEAFASLSGGLDSPLGLNKIMASIHHAKTDSKIKGIYLKTGFFGGGMASLESVRNALIDFKKSGKFIYTYSEFFTETGIYLATVSDSIFVNPQGFVEWNGMAATPMFFKGTFEKLGIEPMLIRPENNKYKSYGETFISKQMSEANRAQRLELMQDIWKHMLTRIAEARKIEVARLEKIATDLAVNGAEDAFKLGLVDALRYEDQADETVSEKAGQDKKKKLRTVSVEKYATNAELAAEFKDDKIAVIYAVGGVNSGKGDNETIGSATMMEALRKARTDDNVKAVVLRVNSPGGSALASDVIWREVMLTKARKPVIASFGDVAASGGYYIAAGADHIVAEPTTITGSIGIFALLFNTERMFEDKLGINTDRVTTNPFADLANPNRRMSPAEELWFRKYITTGYNDFLTIVKDGRKFDKNEDVDKIAQGRVWSGVRAKEIKLVDELGGLDVAIKVAAEKAGLADNYTLVEYPKMKTGLEQIMEGLGTNVRTRVAEMFLSKEERQLMQLRKQFTAERGIYMQMFEDYSMR